METVLGGRRSSHGAGIAENLEGEEGIQSVDVKPRAAFDILAPVFLWLTQLAAVCLRQTRTAQAARRLGNSLGQFQKPVGHHG